MFPSQLVLRLSLALLIILGCTACTEIGNGTTTIKPSPLSSYSADPDSEIGSRNNPVALGKSVEVNDWKVQVTSVNADAARIVLKADPYTSAPSADERFLMIEVKATYIGGESGEPSSDLRFKIVGSKGNTFAKSCGYSADSFNNNGETFPGATVTGNLCFTVDLDQIKGATVAIQQDYSSEGRKFVLIVPK
jgi:hypothetical protein